MAANNGPFGPAKFWAFNAFRGLDIHQASNGIQLNYGLPTSLPSEGMPRSPDPAFFLASGHFSTNRTGGEFFKSLLDHFLKTTITRKIPTRLSNVLAILAKKRVL
jgi:hypothetical protein